jgi:hypothetical protein
MGSTTTWRGTEQPLPSRRTGWVELKTEPPPRSRAAPRADGQGHSFPLFDQRTRTQSPRRGWNRSGSREGGRQNVGATFVPHKDGPTPTGPVFFNSLRQVSDAERRREFERQYDKRERYNNSAYITARARDVTEYEAARIFLEKPDDPMSEHAWRKAQALAREYSMTEDDVRKIWSTKSLHAGMPGGYKLDQLKTDALPNFFPDPLYPDPVPVRPSMEMPPANYSALAEQDARRGLRPPDLRSPEMQLWGPESTTRYMVLDDAPAFLAETEISEAPVTGPRMPKHKLYQQRDTEVKSVHCERGLRPPVGHVDVMILECLNLAVPHKFQNLWNISSVSPYVQVELVERGRNGVEMIQYLKSTTMSRSKMQTFNRSPIDPVFNETCRFQALHLNPMEVEAVSRTTLLVSVLDAESSKCLGCVTIPITDVLKRRAAPYFTWYELMKPGVLPDTLVPVPGSDPSKLSCIQLGFWSNPVPEQVARDVADMTARSAELQAEEVFELYKRVVADMGDEALTLSTRATPKDVERDYQQVRSKYLDLERQSHKLADENLRLAEEEAAIQREAARLSDLKAAQERRKRELSDEQKRLESSGFPHGFNSSPGGGGGYTLPSLPTLEQSLKSTP